MAGIQLTNQVVEVIADVLEMDLDEVNPESKIVSELGADSLDIVDLSFSLGKQLNIKMPQKTVMMHAEEILGHVDDLIDNGTVTELGAHLLQNGPNQYTVDEVFEGKTLAEIFSDTTVLHWANLCQAICDSDLTGDQLIENTVRTVLSKQAA